MNHKNLSLAFASVLAITINGARAADPAVPASVEAADRKFLANLENQGAARPAPESTPVQPSQPAAEAAVKKAAPKKPSVSANKMPEIAQQPTRDSSSKDEPVRVKRVQTEKAEPKAAQTETAEVARPQVGRYATRRVQSEQEELRLNLSQEVQPDRTHPRSEQVEIRRAIPVTTTTATTTVTEASHRDRHDDDEDKNGDDGNGFFHRLFRGEKIFR